MEANGGIILQREYDLLQTELENYFGQQTEIRAGLKPEEPLIAKSPELLRYEMVNTTGLPVWSGGLQDQPHIWLGQYGIIDRVFKIYEAIRIANEEAEAKARRKELNGSSTQR